MNELAVQDKAQGLVISDDTQALITAGVSSNTLRNYRFWSREIEQWLDGRVLDDALLAAYITHLHTEGKSRATISQAVAAVRWLARNTPPQSPPEESTGENLRLATGRFPQAGGRSPVVGGEVLNLPITTRTLAGIRREGKDRGRGQVDGLTWSDVERVCAFADMDKSVGNDGIDFHAVNPVISLAGLRDSALIRLMSDCL